MQPTTNFIVRVPEPCHEDWNKMLPDEKGKFCLSCNKSVFDFSNKTDTEIRNILLEHKDQKVCGHFKKSQVDRPLNIKVDLNDLPKNMSVTKFFAIALFLVFGSILFSCTDKDNKLVGEMAVEIPSQNETKQEITIGQAIMPYVLPTIDTNVVAFELSPEEYMEYTVSGGLAIEYIADEIVPQKDSLVETDEIIYVKGNLREDYIDGGIRLVEEDTKEETDSSMAGQTILNAAVSQATFAAVDKAGTDSTNTISKHSALEVINSKSTSLSIYPNPSSGEFTIRYDVKKRADIKVDILDIKGSHVKSVVNVNGQYEGKYNIPVNLSDLPSGIYFVNLINNGERFTEKVVIGK